MRHKQFIDTYATYTYKELIMFVNCMFVTFYSMNEDQSNWDKLDKIFCFYSIKKTVKLLIDLGLVWNATHAVKKCPWLLRFLAEPLAYQYDEQTWGVCSNLV